MTKVTLPRRNQTGANEFSDVESNDDAIIEVVNGNIDNENIAANAGIVRSKLASDAKGLQGKWYEPKVIATEESRTNTSFGTMTTADEIKEIVLPENGLILVAYSAMAKSSVAEAGRVALYLGSNAVSNYGQITESVITSGSFSRLVTCGQPGVGSTPPVPGNFDTSGGTSTFGTTGVALPPLMLFASAGTYTLSVQFKSSSGSVTVKERKLWVAVLGSGAG